MGLVVDGSMDLGTHIWHPPQIFLQGRITSQRERAWDRDWPGTSNALSNLRLLLVYYLFNKVVGVVVDGELGCLLIDRCYKCPRNSVFRTFDLQLCVESYV